MAVGKGSMERASKAVAKPVDNKVDASEIKTPVKKAPVKKSSPVKKEAVIASTSKQVMEQIVYQSSSQILEREAKPNESFYVGDDMPIYFL